MIELILGPMFSGKSSELLRKVRRFEIAKKRSLVINYTHDNRYSSEEVMSTHDKYWIHSCRLTFKAVKCSSISEVDKIYSSYDVIAIDEGQFFPDVRHLLLSAGGHVRANGEWKESGYRGWSRRDVPTQAFWANFRTHSKGRKGDEAVCSVHVLQ